MGYIFSKTLYTLYIPHLLYTPFLCGIENHKDSCDFIIYMLLFLIVKPFSFMSLSCFILLGLTQSHFLSDKISSHVFISAIFIFILIFLICFDLTKLHVSSMDFTALVYAPRSVFDKFDASCQNFRFLCPKMETWKSYQILPLLSTHNSLSLYK